MKPWCNTKWSIAMGGGEGMTVNFSQKNYRRWNAKGQNSLYYNHINSVWADIEVRNFIIEFLYTHLCEIQEPHGKNEKEQLYIDSLSLLSFDMYVDLEIIRTILEKHFSQKYKSLLQVEKELCNKIIRIRHNLKVHREKPDFYVPMTTIWTSKASGTDLRFTVKDKDGKEISLNLSPQKDAKLLGAILDRIM